MSIQPAWQEIISFPSPRVIVVEPSQAQLSSDAGLLPIRQFDHSIGLTEAFANALDDPRDPDLIDHTTLEMVRARVYGILAGYEDQNDHDTLRDDPIFKLVAGRCPDEDALASQPTLSRFENSINIASLKRLRDVFIDQFIASFAHPPRHLTFDLDAVDDAAHGNQQLTFWHNYYDQNQYLPLLITCAENDQLVMLSLRHGSAHAALGADDDLAYLVQRLRAVWPDIRISARADAAFGIPRMYDICEASSVTYMFGLTTNAVLKRRSEALLAQAEAAWQRERQAARAEGRPACPVRLFDGFWYRAESWPAERWVVVKAEANAEGSQRRFVVTNRPGAVVLPGGTYDSYAQRGESENRNKEFKCDLAMDRLSDHRFLANFFRLYLHAIALNLLVLLRRLIALPLAVETRLAETVAPSNSSVAPVAAAVASADGSEPPPSAALASIRNNETPRAAAVASANGNDTPPAAAVASTSGDDALLAAVVASASNNETPHAAAAALANSGVAPLAVAVASVNGDDTPPAAAVASTSGDDALLAAVVALASNNETPHAAAAALANGGVAPVAVAVASVNGDDTPPTTVVASTSGDDAHLTAVVASARNNETPHAAAIALANSGVAPLAVAVASVNGDDTPPTAAASANGNETPPAVVASADNDDPLSSENYTQERDLGPLPVEAMTGKERSRHFRQRRQRDPLGEGHPCTWRLLFIKVAAEVRVTSRRIVVRLSASWPHLDEYRRVCERLRALLSPVPP